MNSRSASLDRVMRVLRDTLHVDLDAAELPPGWKLDEVAGMDSMAVLEFVAGLEREFGVQIEPEFLELDFLRDLPRVAEYMERRSGGAS